MTIEFTFHPDAEKALEDLRLTIGETPEQPKYASIEEMIIDNNWLSLVKVALDRHPPADMKTAIDTKKAELEAVITAEFEKKRVPHILTPAQVK